LKSPCFNTLIHCVLFGTAIAEREVGSGDDPVINLEVEMKRSQIFLSLLALSFLVGSFTLAQGWGPGRGEGRPAGPAQSVVLQGIVESTDLTPAQGPPSFVVIANGISSRVFLRPFIDAAGSLPEIQRGDEVEVVAFPARWQEGAVMARSVKNLNTGEALQLRNPGARPFRGAGRGGGPRADGPCPFSPNAQDVVVLSGSVTEISGMAAGERFPSVQLITGETVMVGPYRALADSGFKMAPGDELVIRAFPSARVSGAFVALSIENQSNGTSMVLRNDDGFPRGGRGPARRGGRW
jgi:hypothetical protein